ncbi:unnamed protein product [marine sediment metagenome]|uniref:Uncharacterized protein n=1 Tax=marine sediment metagenome TaxID=412755 RepID=X1KBC2_9ZZZZ
MTFSIYSPMIDKAFKDLQAFFDEQVPLEVEYKGCMHDLEKWVQETALDGVDQFVG